MSIASESVTGASPLPSSSTSPSPTRPFYWSVRRELWEYRSGYIAPLVAAGLVLLGFLVRIMHLPQTMRMLATLKPAEQHLALAAPFGIAVVAISITGLIVAFFYCLGALYNERRDRSILFWKSLPVSDMTIVLSKASIPFIVLPIVLFATVMITHLIMLVLGSAALAAIGTNAAVLWSSWPILKMSLVLIYTLVVMTLWYAPIYGWLLLVSSWARSMAILWAVLPPLGLCIAERIAFDTSYLGSLLDYRVNGFLSEAFYFKPHGDEFTDPLALLTPLRFLSTPGLWIGIVLGMGFLAGATWLRRNREPI
jgi:ABC-2 type transport system permease protein